MPSACVIILPPPGPMQRYSGRLRVEAPFARFSKSRSAVWLREAQIARRAHGRKISVHGRGLNPAGTCCGGRRASQLVLSCSGLSTNGSVRRELHEKSGSPFTGNGISIR